MITGRKEILDQIERTFDVACERWAFTGRRFAREIHHRLSAITRDRRWLEPITPLARLSGKRSKLLTEAEGIYEETFILTVTLPRKVYYRVIIFPACRFPPMCRGTTTQSGRVCIPRSFSGYFGWPRALIIMNARYRVYKVNPIFGTDDIEETHNLVTATMKRCPSAVTLILNKIEI